MKKKFVGLKVTALSIAILSSSLCGCTTPHEHEWTDATCTSPKTCTVCEKTEGDTIEHSWKAATCTKAKTCKTCGKTEGAALGHNWTDATYENPKTCKTCGKTVGEKLSYSSDDFFDSDNYLSLYLISSNSADGIQFFWADKYIGTKEIKYYTVYYSMENSVGDPAYDQIKNQSTFKVKISGPISSGGWLLDMSKDSPYVYCQTISKLYVDSIDFEFMDGTTASVEYGWSTTLQKSSNGFTGIWNGIKKDNPDLYSQFVN